MLKILLFNLIWLTLVTSIDAIFKIDSLPVLKLSEVIVMIMALSLRVVNKISTKQLTISMFGLMVSYAFLLFYLFLIFYKAYGYDGNPIVPIFFIGLLSMEIGNALVKTSESKVVKWISDMYNLISSKNDNNRNS